MFNKHNVALAALAAKDVDYAISEFFSHLHPPYPQGLKDIRARLLLVIQKVEGE